MVCHIFGLTFKMLQIYFRVEKEVEKEDDEVFRDSKDLKEGRRPVYIYLLLLSGYILYLTLGGMRALRIQGYRDVGDILKVMVDFEDVGGFFVMLMTFQM